MVEISDVRDFLNNLAVGRVADATIQKQIEIAEEKIANEKSSNASASAVKQATLTFASYLTYLAYVTEYERTAGVVPGFMVGHLQVLKELADSFLNYIKKGTPSPVAAVAQPSSLEEELNAT